MLASCGASDNTSTMDSGSGTTSSASGTKVAPTSVVDGAYVSVYYTLRIWSHTWEIYESNFPTAESIEKSQTLDFMIGAGGMIPGFEKGIMGMKKGDKKTIEVPPELGYGNEPRIASVDISEVAPKFTITRDKKIFSDTVTETVKKSDIQESMRSATVWQYLTWANGISAKVTKVTDSDITLEVKNPQNIFSGKELTVGTQVDLPDNGGTAKIIWLKWTGITLEVINKKSPFYNKKFAIGETTDITWANGRNEGKIEIRGMSGDTISIAQYTATTGKTLFFDVEVVDIK